MIAVGKTTVPVYPRSDIPKEFQQPYCINVEFTPFNPELETIVLLHGYMGSTEDYEYAFETLKALNIIAIDLRGHGQSDTPMGKEISWLMEDLASDVKQTLDMVLPPEHRITIVASSLSTAIALEMAKNYPDLVKKLLLLSATSKFVIPPWVKLALNISTLTPGKLTDFLIDFMYMMLIRIIPTEDPEIYEKTLARFKELELLLHQKIINETLTEWEANLENITQPVLVIAGLDDQIVPFEDSLALVERLPNASLLSLANAEHFLLSQKTKEVFDILSQWMKQDTLMRTNKYYSDKNLTMENGTYVLFTYEEVIRDSNGNKAHIEILDH